MSAPPKTAHWWMQPLKHPLHAVCQHCKLEVKLSDVEEKTGYFMPAPNYGGACKGKNEGELPGMVEI